MGKPIYLTDDRDYTIIPDEVLHNPSRLPITDGEVAWVRLTQGMWALIDAEYAGTVGGWLWHARIGMVWNWYAQRGLHPGVLGMHRLICELAYGPPPDGYTPDHINGTLLSPNILDNRRSNLRWADRGTQDRNKRSERAGRFTSKYQGVAWYGQRMKWRASIRIDHHNYYLGMHDSEEDAATCYLLARGLWEQHGILPSEVL